MDKQTLFILEAAALTHDIGIHLCEEKYGDCSGKLQEKEGPAIAARLLGELGFEKQVSERVQYLIAHHLSLIHILITHDENIALQADRIIAIEDGGITRDEVIRG